MRKSHQTSTRMLVAVVALIAAMVLTVQWWSATGQAAPSTAATNDLSMAAASAVENAAAQNLDAPNAPVGEAVLGDFVWLDLDLNGIEGGAGEEGISGVFLRLWLDTGDFTFNANEDTIVATTVTADGSVAGKPKGFYQFFATRDLTYFVEVMDSNFEPGGPLHNTILTSSLIKGPEPMMAPSVDSDGTDTIDFGYAPAGIEVVKLAGTAPDGGIHYVPPAGDSVTFTYNYTNTGSVELINVAITDDNGTQADPNDDHAVCTVASLPPGATGNCTLQLSINSNHTNVASIVGTPTINFINGADVTDTDNAIVNLYAALGDRVWNDVNANGIQDAGESSVPNVAVELFNSGGQSLGTTTTGTGGTYRFDNLTAGQYRLKFSLPAGFQFSPQNAVADDTKDSDVDPANGETPLITLAGGEEQLIWDAGIYNNAGIGDRVWEDLNANGIQDSGELGIPNVTVRLFSGAGTELTSDTTNGDGLYRFSNLVGGDYYLVFDAPAGYSFTSPNAGGDTEDSDFDPALGKTATFTLATGGSDNTWDAGLYRSASLGDRVWQDLNANGIQDSGEPNIGSASVELRNSGGVVDTKTTDGNGNYSFTGLMPGMYQVRFVTPSGGFQPTLQNQGGDDTKDSDADVNSGLTGNITLISGQNDPTWDAGFYKPGLINVVKSADPTVIVSGQQVTYTYVVTNSGGLPIQNVVVSDDKCSPMSSLLSGDTDNDGLLDTTESWRYSCTTSLTQTTLNTVTAAGTDLANNPVSNTATATVTVVAPQINVVKTANPTTILANQDVVYNYVVTNPGDVALATVGLVDNKCASVAYLSGDADNDSLLDTSESWTYSCTQKLTVSTTNTVTATGQPANPAGTPYPGIGPVQDQDTAQVTVVAPQIQVVKSVAPGTVYANGTVVYTLQVSNPGNVTLASINLSDNQCSPLTRTGGDVNNNNRLETTETWTYTCSKVLTKDTTNTATVTGQPVNGSGTPFPGINPVSDQDTALANVINPAIQIVKSASANIVNQGDLVTYTYDVTNIGDDPLTSVVTSDNVCSPLSSPVPQGSANGDNVLDPGETWRYTCEMNLTQDTTNIATTTANDSLGNPVTDTDEVFVDVIAAGIQLDKSATPTMIYSGNSVTYEFRISNTGTDPLSNIQLTDDKCTTISARISGDTNTNDLLDPSEVWIYNCTRNVAVDTVNVATATGEDSLGSPQSDQGSASVNVIKPAINVVKSVDRPVILSGEQVIYTYLVTNPGDDPLSNVSMSDDKCPSVTAATPNPGDLNNVGKLDPGETWTYSCTTSLTVDTVNVITAMGTDSLNGTVTETDTASVDVVAPAISLDKSVDKSVVRPGTGVVYTFVAENTGDVPLANVVLTDNQCSNVTYVSGDVNSNSIMETTESWTYTCPKTITQNTVNTAQVSGQPSDVNGVALPGISPVTAQDTATVSVITSGLSVEKSANPTVIYSGNSVTYSYVVRNLGNSTLDTVTISDDKCNPVSLTGGDANNNFQLETTEVWTYSCTASLTVDTTNTVTVTAKDPTGGSLNATDTAVVNVINPAITIDKQTTVTSVAAGTVVTYTYAVSNSGDDPLSTVVVDDDKCSQVNFVGGDTNNDGKLDLTEVWNYTCSTALATTTTNVATATGNDSLGNPVNDTDSVTVTVFQLAGIGDRVWLDTNANGIQDGGESGVANVAVTLYRNNTVVATQNTGNDGSYLFSGLTPGDYAIGVALPSGYRFSPQDQGQNDGVDSDVNTNTGRTTITNLASGETDRTWDAGIYQPASIGNYVWEDSNGNGLQDSTEIGVGGVTVFLYDESGNVVDTATTQADGSYLFDNLTPGTYQVQFEAPLSYVFTSQFAGSDTGADSDANPSDGKANPVTVTSGQQNLTVDAGIYRLARVGDRVWYDANSDGIFNNGESGADGVVVTLFKAGGAQVATQTTASGGLYTFSGLVPGEYYVHFALPTGYVFSDQYVGNNRTTDSNADKTTGNTETVTLASNGIDLTLDAGLVVAAPDLLIVKTASLAVDDDENGVVSPGDTLAYKITISNIGTAPSTDINFTDGLDPNTTLVVGSVTTTQGTVILGNVAGNTDAKVNVGTLLPGQSAVIDLHATINDPLPAGVTQVVNQGVVDSVELPDEPTDDDGLGGGTGDPTTTTVRPRGFQLFLPFMSAFPPAAPTPTPSPTPSPTPTPDDGSGSLTGIPCPAPGCTINELYHPKGMAMNVSTNMLYVVSRDNDRLLKINPQTMQVVASAATGDEPWGVVVNENTNLVYVGNFASANVMVYNGDTLALVATIRLGNPGDIQPAMMEILPGINTVGVVLRGGNGVAIIQGLTVTQIVGATGIGTYGLAADTVNNRFFVSNRDAGNIRVLYRTEFGLWKNDGYNFTYSDRRIPFDLAYNPNNKRLYSVYVINADWFVDVYGERNDGSWGLITKTQVGSGGSPRNNNVGGTGLVVNLATGNVFNVNSADNTVTVMNANGQIRDTVGTGVDPFTAVVNPARGVVFVGMRDVGDTTMSTQDSIQKIIDNY